MTSLNFAGTMTKFCFKFDGVVNVFNESSACASSTAASTKTDEKFVHYIFNIDSSLGSSLNDVTLVVGKQWMIR